MIEIDGSLGEGGGQILRTSVALASVLGKDVRVFNIRAGRPRPGIMAQHLVSVKAAANISGASVAGGQTGSAELSYRPGRVRSGSFHFDIGTAGSVTLVLQTLLPLLTHAQGEVEIQLTGGTDVKWSPPVDYLRLVALPILRSMGFESHLAVYRRGHYPRGGGEVKLVSRPAGGLQALTGLRPGKPVRIDGVSHATKLPHHVADRQVEAARRLIVERGLPNPALGIDVSDSGLGASPGSGLVLAATMEGGAIVGADSLGERGKPAEEVGGEAGRLLMEELESGAFLDRHMGDMVIPYMVLAEGVSDVSVSRITKHTLTNVRVAESLAGVRFQVQGELDAPGVLRVKGLGLRSVSPSSPTGVSHLSRS